MREKGDVVRWKNHRGKYRLWRSTVTATGVKGWIVMGRDRLSFIKEEEIK